MENKEATYLVRCAFSGGDDGFRTIEIVLPLDATSAMEDLAIQKAIGLKGKLEAAYYGVSADEQAAPANTQRPVERNTPSAATPAPTRAPSVPQQPTQAANGQKVYPAQDTIPWDYTDKRTNQVFIKGTHVSKLPESYVRWVAEKGKPGGFTAGCQAYLKKLDESGPSEAEYYGNDDEE